jgi:peptidoglycan/LPS O-acetylase OafA/YrhL
MKADRNLDILRAIAVLAVLVAHCLPLSPLQQAVGHYGVLIFFVHTCLVLLLSLERQSGEPRLAARFYIQRVFRIYPLSILCVLTSLAFRIGWPDGVFPPRSGISIAANILLVQNFLRESSISAPLWSLPYELQMYAVLPAISAFVRTRGTRALFTIVGLSILIPIAELAVFGQLLITTYLPCFMGGVLAFVCYRSPRRVVWWLWPVCVIDVFGAYLFLGLHWSSAVADAWLVCIALGLLLPLFRAAPENSVARAAGLLARYSYGIYLSHVPLLWLCFHGMAGFSGATRWVTFIVLMTIVPVGLYHLVEEPMIRLGKALSSKAVRAASPRALLLPADSSRGA